MGKCARRIVVGASPPRCHPHSALTRLRKHEPRLLIPGAEAYALDHARMLSRAPLAFGGSEKNEGERARENVGRFPRCGALFLGLRVSEELRSGRPPPPTTEVVDPPPRASVTTRNRCGCAAGLPLPVTPFVRDDGNAARVVRSSSCTSRCGVFPSRWTPVGAGFV
ncbi:hypothetical protein MTO96_000920 [Rhipicephalus appendiculatus]